MRLSIIRHGKAESESPTGRDEDRPLRPRGRRQAHWLAEQFAGSDPPLSLILTSHLVRALATAKVLQARTGCRMLREVALEGGHTPSDILGLLATLPETAGEALSTHVALVGHNPHLEALAAVLLHGPSGAVGEPLRTGEAVVVDIADPGDPVGRAVLVARMRLEDDD